MAFIPVPDTAEVELIGDLFGQIVENTLYFQTDGGWIGSALAQLAASVADWAVTSLLSGLSSDYSLQRVVATDISVSSGAQSTFVTDLPVSGGTESASMPGGTAGCISFRTGFAGRSFRGRNYICGIPEAHVLGNQIDASFLDFVVGAYNDLQGAVTDDLPDAVWCVASRYHANAPRVAGVTTPVTVALYADRNVDSQRRRLAGRGS